MAPYSRGCQSRFTGTGSSRHCTGVSGFLLVPHLLQRHSNDLTLLCIDQSRGRHCSLHGYLAFFQASAGLVELLEVAQHSVRAATKEKSSALQAIYARRENSVNSARNPGKRQ
jgi:hypothetical protein